MKQSLASASAGTWNQKNLPSDVEPFEQDPVRARGMVGRAPAAALALARRRPVLFLVAAVGVLSLVWIVSHRD
jgi:hypothetical protein